MRAKVLFAMTAIALLGGAPKSHAAEKVRCEILAIEASNKGLGIDAALAAHQAIFRAAPFSAFDTFKLVHRQTYELSVSTPKSLSLPDSLGGTLRFGNMDRDGKLDLTLTITRQGKKPISIDGKASPGAPFFAAGFKSQGGTWVFGVLCSPSPITND